MQKVGNWKPYNVKAILNNVNLVFKTKDITKLNNPAYSFLHSLNGFIAHYNLQGFHWYYRDLRRLINDLDADYLRTDATRDETDIDFEEWYGKAYNKSKADIKRGLADISEKYENEIYNYFNAIESRDAVATVKTLIEKYHIDVNTL